MVCTRTLDAVYLISLSVQAGLHWLTFIVQMILATFQTNIDAFVYSHKETLTAQIEHFGGIHIQ